MEKDLAVELNKATIKKVFDQRSDFIIIGLTGAIGSNLPQVRRLIQKEFYELNLPENSCSSDIIAQLEYKRIYDYAKLHWKKFDLIKARDIIITYILENKTSWNYFVRQVEQLDVQGVKDKTLSYINIALNQLNSNNEQDKKIIDNLIRFKQRVLENDLRMELTLRNNELKDFIDVLKKEKFDVSEDSTNFSLYVYTKYILPEFGKALKSSMPQEQYVTLFQKLGNEIRFFGTLDTRQWKKRIESMVHGPKCDHFYSIAKRLNTFIKIRRSPFYYKKSVPIQIVIDSLKNPYEFSFLKDRYSAYYTVAVLQNQENNESQKKYCNFYENPGHIKKDFQLFIHLLSEQVKSKQMEVGSKTLRYIQALRSADDYINYMMICLNELEAEEDESGIEWSFQFDDIAYGETYEREGISEEKFKFLITILSDPVKTFCLITELYTFYMQDVQSATQNADIFLNGTQADKKISEFTYSLVKYISLIMHPALVPPTPIERCMQIAFSAKVNSGCISRQVGAVVTNKRFDILGIGWNDVPQDNVPCIYRNLEYLSRNEYTQIFSDMELDPKSTFRNHIKYFDFTDYNRKVESFQGMQLCYCFKGIYNTITHERNPINSRAIHAEANAIYSCGNKDELEGGNLFTTSSSCENCTLLVKKFKIKKVYYIEQYPGIAQVHVNSSGDPKYRAEFILFQGAIGSAYTKLYTPVLPMKDELTLRGLESFWKNPYCKY